MDRADQRKVHFIYRTTCLITNRFYLGMHSTDDLNDGYLGSGRRIVRSISKHGVDNHIREILDILPDRKSLREREKQIITDELLNDPLCMNLARGGEGGWDYINENHLSPVHDRSHPSYEKMVAGIPQANRHPSRKETNIKNLKGGMKGKHHSECAKQNMSIAQMGKKNSQFGTVWMTHPDHGSRKFAKDAIDVQITLGWRLGRH